MPPRVLGQERGGARQVQGVAEAARLTMHLGEEAERLGFGPAISQLAVHAQGEREAVDGIVEPP